MKRVSALIVLVVYFVFIVVEPASAEIGQISFVESPFSNALWAIFDLTVYVYGDEPVTCIGHATSEDPTQAVFNFTLDLSIPTGFGTQASFGDYFYYIECNSIPFGGNVYAQGRQTSVNFHLVRIVQSPTPPTGETINSEATENFGQRLLPICDWGVVFVFWYQDEGLAVYRGNDHGTADQLVGIWVETDVETSLENETLAWSEDGTIIVSRLSTGEIQVNYALENTACVINPETRTSYRVPVS